MRSIRNEWLVALLIVFLGAAAARAQTQNQPVYQSGLVTPGHPVQWLQNGVVGDAGGAAGGTVPGVGYLTELGITNTGTPFCINDALITSQNGYHQFCLGSLATIGGATGAFLTYNAYGGAAPQSIYLNLNGVNYPIAFPAVNGLPEVATEAALAAEPATFAAIVLRRDYAQGNGATPLYYISTGGACSLNSGAGDGGSQVPASDGGCWLAQFPSGPFDIREWGAVCNGSPASDATAAITAAVSYATSVVGALSIPSALSPTSGCYTASGINAGTVPLVGAVPMVPTNPPAGAVINCPAALAGPCVISGIISNTQNFGGALQDLIVAYIGTPIAGDAGIQVEGYNSRQSWTEVYNAYDGFHFFRGNFSKASIADHAVNIFTCEILHNHLVDDGTPEVYIDQGRIGCNGETTTGTNAYVAFTGQDPNGFTAIGTHFNQGVVGVAHFLDFDGLTSQVNGEYRFVGIHVEGLIATGSGGSVYYSGDQSGTCLKCSTDVATVFNDTSTTFQSGIGAMTNSIFKGNYFLSDITFDPSVTYSSLNLGDINAFSGGGAAITITGASGSDMIVHDIRSNGTFTVSGGPWTALRLSNILPGSYHDTAATGAIYAANVPMQVFSPTVLFGGSPPPSPWAFSTVGKFSRMPDGTVETNFGAQATASGSTSGAIVTMGGFPYTCAASAVNSPGRASGSASHMTGLVPPFTVSLNQSSSVVDLGQWSSTGIANLLDTNLLSNSVWSGITSCVPQ